MSLTIAAKRARFAELHKGPGCFIIPNPWDVGSAKYLASLGFKALATTSAGAAFAMGRPDGGLSRAAVLAHIGDLAGAVDLPFNADYEAGFAETRDELHESAVRCIATGVAGFSIEDYTGAPGAPFYGLEEAARRIRVARAAIDASGEQVLLTARSETVLRAHPEGLKEALRRLAAYAEAGADVLYAPGVRSAEEVAEVVRVAGPLPVNVLAGGPAFTLRQLEDLGVRRISVGGALARAAWGGFIRAAQDIAQHGRFDSLAHGAPFGDLQKLFGGDFGLTPPIADGPSPRRAGLADVAAVAALQHAAYARNRAALGVEPLPLLADYREVVTRMEVWLFGPGEALRGVLALEAEPDALLIWSVACAPAAQGAGLGRIMLDFAQARAREMKLPAIRLYTGEKLASNVDWYRRSGFAIDRVEALADRSIVHMSKRLD